MAGPPGATIAAVTAPVRKILHLDMDAFYASVEQLDHPELRGRPIAVGGSPKGRGVVAAASYEARAFGVRSATNAAQALRLCPALTFVTPRFRRYQEVSKAVFSILRTVTPLVEPLSIDEAFLDVTDNALGEPSGTRVAEHLRARIQAELGLTASVGVSHLKFVAKIASAFQKPDGLTVVPPGQVLAFLHPLPVERLWGVGPVSAQKLHEHDLHTIGDLYRADPATVAVLMGSHGHALVRMARGDWQRAVVPHRRRRSHSAERNFAEDQTEMGELIAVARAQADRVAESVRKRGRVARTVSVKVRYSDFTTVSRSETLTRPTADPDVVAAVARGLLAKTEAGRRPGRLLGVGLSGLEGAPLGEQLELWDGLPTGPTQLA